MSSASGQLVVTNIDTPEDLVQNVLLGGGVTVSNVTFNGALGTMVHEQAGFFDGSMSNIGLQSGVILASGDVTFAVGPNSQGGGSLGGGNFGAGDPDLDQINAAAMITTHDAAILEFDFIPTGDSISFRYVFASEEYDEYVCGTVNDVFGFFLSGPGIAGPFSNNAVNLAVLPGGNIPVSINTVNNGQVGANAISSTPCDNLDPSWTNNTAYYISNAGGTTVEYDGQTVVLTATALVQCGQTYHIKLAIADGGDTVLDSGVFLEGGSFASPNSVQVDVATVAADGTMTEGCTDAVLTITRPDSSGIANVDLTVSGSATNGVDYTQIPTSIMIPAGQSSVSFPISAFEDGLSDPGELIIFTSIFTNACGDTTISTDSVMIVEYAPIEIMVEDLNTDCPDDSVQLVAAATGGYQSLSFEWSDGTPGNAIWVPANVDGTYQITVTDGCPLSDSALVHVDATCEIIIPNVFTPNGDPWNNRFEIEGIESRENFVRIFNRWGQVIFEKRNYRNTWSAPGVSDGTYYYEVKVEGESEPYTGHVTIISNGRRP